MAASPPERMDLFEALVWCDQGYAIRRAIWNGGVTLQTPAPTAAQIAAAHPLAWVTYARGLYTYREIAAEGRVTRVGVVKAEDVILADYQAIDWTAIAPTTDNNDLINPPKPSSATTGGGTGSGSSGGSSGSSGGSGSGSSSGSGDGSGGGGSGGSDGSSGGGGSGDSGGAGSGAGGQGGRKPKSTRTPPDLTVDLTRSSGDACVPLGPNDAPMGDDITDSFTGIVKLGADPQGRAGELWFLTVTHGTPKGTTTDYHGTVAAGDATSVAFSITAKPGQTFGVQASAHLPHVALNSQGNGSAAMRKDCAPKPSYRASPPVGAGNL